MDEGESPPGNGRGWCDGTSRFDGVLRSGKARIWCGKESRKGLVRTLKPHAACDNENDLLASGRTALRDALESLLVVTRGVVCTCGPCWDRIVTQAQRVLDVIQMGIRTR